jgi:hypothetical protein
MHHDGRLGRPAVTLFSNRDYGRFRRRLCEPCTARIEQPSGLRECAKRRLNGQWQSSSGFLLHTVTDYFSINSSVALTILSLFALKYTNRPCCFSNRIARRCILNPKSSHSKDPHYNPCMRGNDASALATGLQTAAVTRETLSAQGF